MAPAYFSARVPCADLKWVIADCEGDRLTAVYRLESPICDAACAALFVTVSSFLALFLSRPLIQTRYSHLLEDIYRRVAVRCLRSGRGSPETTRDDRDIQAAVTVKWLSPSRMMYYAEALMYRWLLWLLLLTYGKLASCVSILRQLQMSNCVEWLINKSIIQSRHFKWAVCLNFCRVSSNHRLNVLLVPFAGRHSSFTNAHSHTWCVSASPSTTAQVLYYRWEVLANRCLDAEKSHVPHSHVRFLCGTVAMFALRIQSGSLPLVLIRISIWQKNTTLTTYSFQWHYGCDSH